MRLACIACMWCGHSYLTMNTPSHSADKAEQKQLLDMMLYMVSSTVVAHLRTSGQHGEHDNRCTHSAVAAHRSATSRIKKMPMAPSLPTMAALFIAIYPSAVSFRFVANFFTTAARQRHASVTAPSPCSKIARFKTRAQAPIANSSSPPKHLFSAPQNCHHSCLCICSIFYLLFTGQLLFHAHQNAQIIFLRA